MSFRDKWQLVRSALRPLKRFLINTYWTLCGRHICYFLSRNVVADVAIFHHFMPPPYGGGNQFMLALATEFEQKELTVSRNQLSKQVSKVIINSFNFNEIVFDRMQHPQCRVLHRVDGPISVYRGSDSKIDEDILKLNQKYADVTVFQSQYSLRKHEEMGLKLKNPVVIYNAVDSALFNKKNRCRFDKTKRIRLLAVSWSSNPNKGWLDYSSLADILDPERYEFIFLGRALGTHPKINSMPATDSLGVANILKEVDIYITASRHEPCSNSLIEALSCGLPVVHINSGSHSELVKEAGLGFDDIAEAPALLDEIVENYDVFCENIEVPLIEDVAKEYRRLLEI